MLATIRTLRTPTARMGLRAMSSDRLEPQQAESLMQIGTRTIFDSDHDMFREMARKFFEDEVVPHHEQWEKDGQVSRELWLKAGANGLLGTTMPSEYGGSDADVLYAAIVWEEQSYSGCTGPGFALHSEIVMPYILNYGTEEQKNKFLPPLITGEHIGAIAMSEPSAGSDLQGMRTTAAKSADGSHYVMNGSKTFITNGWLGDTIIVCAKTDPSAGAKGISLFIVEEGMEGFKKGRKLNKMGMKAQDTAELFFEDVKVPAENLLGPENMGFMLLMKELPQERLLIADMGLAAAEACFEWTRSYVKERKAFGKELVKLQTIQHKMAEMKTELTVGRAFADRCLDLHKDEKLDNATASMAKYWLTDLQDKVANDCVQLHGGWGYMWEYPVCRAFVDGRVQRIYGGTNEIMKELIARTL